MWNHWPEANITFTRLKGLVGRSVWSVLKARWPVKVSACHAWLNPKLTTLAPRFAKSEKLQLQILYVLVAHSQPVYERTVHDQRHMFIGWHVDVQVIDDPMRKSWKVNLYFLARRRLRGDLNFAHNPRNGSFYLFLVEYFTRQLCFSLRGHSCWLFRYETRYVSEWSGFGRNLIIQPASSFTCSWLVDGYSATSTFEFQ